MVRSCTFVILVLAVTGAVDGAPNWTQRFPSGVFPAPRVQSSMAYDGLRAKLFMFGGLDDNLSRRNDTFEWTGTQWTGVPTVSAPAARSNHQLVYDASRNVMVLFGGDTANNVETNETYTFDGTVWTRQSPAQSPPARRQFGMAYDADRGRVVLFGGGISGLQLQDTWEWDGTNWSQKTPVTKPSARSDLAMAFDPIRRRVLLYGGRVTFSASGQNNETWEWNGTEWTQLQPATNPGPRAGHTLSPGADSGPVLFGGFGPSDVTQSSTWQWDGNTWVQVVTANSPTQRALHTAGRDSAKGQFIVFGGQPGGSSPIGDTWELSEAFPGNNAPVVSAGNNRTAETGTQVSLTASATDADSDPISYVWIRSGGAGPAVSINDGTQATAKFVPPVDGTYTFTVRAADGKGGTSTAQVTITAQTTQSNRPPIADAGQDRNVNVGSLVTLSAAGTDPDGDPVTYAWIRDGGTGPEVTLDNANTRTPSFTPSEPGLYAFTVTVSDGRGGEGEDTVVITAMRVNSAPTANAGADRTVTVQTAVTLQGSGSDADGDTLSYAWVRTGGTGPAVTLDDDTAQTPTFTPGVAGTYVFTLTVSDSGGGTATDSVTITVSEPQQGNRPPVANAGADQTVTAGAIVTLSGSGTDPDGDPLTYSWLRNGGTGPVVELGSGNTRTPSFSAAVAGTYVFSLTVDDSRGGSSIDSVTIVVNDAQQGNRAPTASAGSDRTVVVGGRVTLNGSADDADNDALSYSWTRDGGTGPAVTLNGASTAQPSFTPAVAGSYIFALSVSDGKGGTAGATVTITAANPPPPGPGAGTWFQKQGAGPGFRFTMGMCYDLDRRKVVMFGGGSSLGNDLWEWDGTFWTRRNSATAPSPRKNHAMVYDAARKRIVMFGGLVDVNNNEDNETWEFDGTNWTKRVPLTAPPPRAFHAMCYDERRQRTFLAAGEADFTRLDDAWEWDGTNWTQVGNNVGLGKAQLQLAFDSRRGFIVAFGGRSGSSCSFFTDTREWDGSRFVEVNLDPQQQRLTAPAGRKGHSMVYDPVRQGVVLFGGEDCNVGLADTWLWNGLVWRQLNVTRSPQNRESHGVAYDAARQRVVIYGGDKGGDPFGPFDALGPPDDVWELPSTEDRWDRRTLPERKEHAIAYDAARQKVVLFGGSFRTSPGKFGDTWLWDGSTWTEQFPFDPPPARQLHAMAYDSARQRVVLFGGSGPNNAALNDTWEWDGTDWIERTPASAPSPRSAHSMTYHAATGRTLLFGGLTSVFAEGRETWEWDGTNWSKRNPASSPFGATNSPLAYDAARQRSVLHLGGAGTWEWDGTNWRSFDLFPPPARSAASMVYDAGRGRVVLFGGERAGFSDALDDTAEWNGSTWTTITPTFRPPARKNHAMAYDSARGRVVMVGGFPRPSLNGLVESNDTWELAPAVSCSGTIARIDLSGQPGGGPQVVGLDGSASAGVGLRYSWALTQSPPGAAPFDATGAVVSYDARVAGGYAFTLTITDEFGCSDTEQAVFSVGNARPSAAVAQQVTIILPNGSVVPADQTTTSVTLDGSGSFDPGGGTLTYEWTLVSQPDASTLQSRFSGLVRNQPVLTVPFGGQTNEGRLVDAGVYVFRLTVTDASNASDSRDVQVIAIDPAALVPRADAGAPQTVEATLVTSAPFVLAQDIPDVTMPPGSARLDFIKLDGRASADSNVPQRPLDYQWRFVELPAGAPVTELQGRLTALPSFVPPMAGRYTIELRVSNGFFVGAPSRTTVDVSFRTANRPPVARPRVVDPEPPGRLASAGDPPLVFGLRERISLDGRASVDPDNFNRIAGYVWRQVQGDTVALFPADSLPVVGFIPTRAGRYGFTLEVTDQSGAKSPPARIDVVASDELQPRLSLVASANTTTATAPDTGARPVEGKSPFLRVRIGGPTATKVRLAAFSLDVAAPGFIVDWRQVSGPTTLLLNVAAANLRAGEISAVEFQPTTHRVHLFEAELQPLNTLGFARGASTIRRIQVAVDSAATRVPEAVARVAASGKSKATVAGCQEVTLDGRDSSVTGQVTALIYRWVQTEGPPVVLSDSTGAVTTFVTPDFGVDRPEPLRFQLFVSDTRGTVSPPAIAEVDVTSPTSAPIDLTLDAGVTLIGLPANPVSGRAARLSDLVQLTGGGSIVFTHPTIDRFVVHDAAIGLADLPLDGGQGYILLRGSRPALPLVRPAAPKWSQDMLVRRLRRGLNLVAYPRGVPSGETAASLLRLTGASYVARLVKRGNRAVWEAYLPGLTPVPFPIEAGVGYAVRVPADVTVQLPFNRGCE